MSYSAVGYLRSVYDNNVGISRNKGGIEFRGKTVDVVVVQDGPRGLTAQTYVPAEPSVLPQAVERAGTLVVQWAASQGLAVAVARRSPPEEAFQAVLDSRLFAIFLFLHDIFDISMGSTSVNGGGNRSAKLSFLSLTNSLFIISMNLVLSGFMPNKISTGVKYNFLLPEI